jgi:hypothetical protein
VEVFFAARSAAPKVTNKGNKVDSNDPSSSSSSSSSDGIVAEVKKEVEVIDARRAQNLTIAMRKLGQNVSYEEIAKSIKEANLEYLNEDKVDLLNRLALEPDEMSALKAAEVVACFFLSITFLCLLPISQLRITRHYITLHTGCWTRQCPQNEEA